ncbi:hypothetical protein ILP97_43175 [Amycolatopsis sp. H6(2020)]|nr:hypothetical protein [Amycolatopsis sp. H6(2020)]
MHGAHAARKQMIFGSFIRRQNWPKYLKENAISSGIDSDDRVIFTSQGDRDRKPERPHKSPSRKLDIMVSPIHPKHRPSLNRIAEALQAQPPRVRSALKELREVFTDSGENPPAILAACATLLNTDDAISGDVLAAVRSAHAEWDSYGERERELFNQCVYTSETRRAVAVTEVNDVTVMLREQPPRIADALNGLRWLNAATGGTQQHAFTTCATLLKNPSATHPAIVEAIHTAHKLWPSLAEDMRTLVMACVYASKARAEHARAHAAARQQAVTAEAAEPHRCGSCDGNLADTPELPYCSDACRREAESAQRPMPGEHTATEEPATAPEATAPAPMPGPATEATPKTTAKRKTTAKAGHEPIEKKADGRYVVGEIEAQFDEQWRQIKQAIPTAGFVRKDERGVDLYEQERQRHADLDDSSDAARDVTGYTLSDEDYERLALLPVTPGGLCVACNLERTPAEQRAQTDDRCEMCRDRDMPPLITFAPFRELAAVA